MSPTKTLFRNILEIWPSLRQKGHTLSFTTSPASCAVSFRHAFALAFEDFFQILLPSLGYPYELSWLRRVSHVGQNREEYCSCPVSNIYPFRLGMGLGAGH